MYKPSKYYQSSTRDSPYSSYSRHYQKGLYQGGSSLNLYSGSIPLQTSLLYELAEEKLYNNRSKKIMDDLISSEQKLRSHLQPSSSQNFLKTNSHHDALCSKPYLTLSSSSKNFPQGRSHSNFEKNQKIIPTGVNSSYKKLNFQEPSEDRALLLRKLYQDSKCKGRGGTGKEQGKGKEGKEKEGKEGKEEGLGRGKEERGVAVGEKDMDNDVGILIQQLKEKNKIIVDLQCKLLKLQNQKQKLDDNLHIKEIQTLTSLDQKQSINGNSQPIPVKRQNKIDKQCINIKCISHTPKQKKVLQTQNKNKRVLTICGNFTITVPKTQEKQTMEKEPKLQCIHSSVETIQFHKQIVNPSNLILEKPQTTPQPQTPPSLNEPQSTPHKLSSLDSQPFTQSLQFKSQQICSLQLSHSSQSPPKVLKKVSQCPSINFTLQSVHSVQVRQSSTQTSTNYYDYIQQAYLQWVFHKDFLSLKGQPQGAPPQQQQQGGQGTQGTQPQPQGAICKEQKQQEKQRE